jgi:hypothetical protein
VTSILKMFLTSIYAMSEIEEYTERIYSLLRELKRESPKGSFNLVKKGHLIEPSKRSGLAFSAFAAKIAYTINVVDRFSQEEVRDWANYIKSFQTSDGIRRGFFEDEGLTKSLDGIAIRSKRIRGPFQYFIKDMKARRAETRQACAALGCLNETAETPLCYLAGSKVLVHKLFHQLNWKNPWTGGSHFSHLIFFLNYNIKNFNDTDCNGDASSVLLEEAWDELEKIRDPEIGLWYKGRAQKNNILNGGMKVLNAYAYQGREIPDPKKIIDYALSIDAMDDGCHFLNQIYVLYRCSRQINYRKEEILDLVAKAKKKIEVYKKEEGGFSFFPKRSQVTYYGQKVAQGLNESDLHATHLFTWALMMIFDFEADFKLKSWQAPVT